MSPFTSPSENWQWLSLVPGHQACFSRTSFSAILAILKPKYSRRMAEYLELGLKMYCILLFWIHMRGHYADFHASRDIQDAHAISQHTVSKLCSPRPYNSSFWPTYGIQVTSIPLSRIPNGPPATRARLRPASTLLISVLDTALRSILPYNTKLPRLNGKRKRQNGWLMCKICRRTQHSNTLHTLLWMQEGISTIGHGLIYQVYTLSKVKLYTARHGNRIWISLGRS